MNTFADFADAMARPSAPAPVTSSALERVAVLGGGPEGRMLAAIALSEGVEVTLFTAYGTEREAGGDGGALDGAFLHGRSCRPGTAECEGSARGAKTITARSDMEEMASRRIVPEPDLGELRIQVRGQRGLFEGRSHRSPGPLLSELAPLSA